jgi:hypothetical protein
MVRHLAQGTRNILLTFSFVVAFPSRPLLRIHLLGWTALLAFRLAAKAAARIYSIHPPTTATAVQTAFRTALPTARSRTPTSCPLVQAVALRALASGSQTSVVPSPSSFHLHSSFHHNIARIGHTPITLLSDLAWSSGVPWLYGTRARYTGND